MRSVTISRPDIKGLGVLVYLVCCFSMNVVFGQQDAQFSQVLLAKQYFNPSEAGRDMGWNNVGLIHRSQWSGYNTSFDQNKPPTTQLLTVGVPLSKYNLGTGVTFVRDEFGPVTKYEFALNLSYHYRIATHQISLGVKGGVINQKVEYQTLRWIDPNDPLNTGQGALAQTIPDFGVGVTASNGVYYISLAANHLNTSEINYGTDIAYEEMRVHYYSIMSYDIAVGVDSRLTPLLFIKSLGSIGTTFEFGGVFDYLDKFYAGVIYRDNESFNLLAGVKFGKSSQYRLGYAFDIVVEGAEAKSQYSHEFGLFIDLPALTFPEKIIQRSPRYRL